MSKASQKQKAEAVKVIFVKDSLNPYAVEGKKCGGLTIGKEYLVYKKGGVDGNEYTILADDDGDESTLYEGEFKYVVEEKVEG